MFLKIAQAIISLILIIVILLQAKGTGLSSIFGGDGGFYRTKRGFERFLFIFTIILSVLFAIVSVLRIIY